MQFVHAHYLHIHYVPPWSTVGRASIAAIFREKLAGDPSAALGPLVPPVTPVHDAFTTRHLDTTLGAMRFDSDDDL